MGTCNSEFSEVNIFFIRYGMRSFFDTIPFWIGGSANPDPHVSYFSNYMQNDSGITTIRSHVKDIRYVNRLISLMKAVRYKKKQNWVLNEEIENFKSWFRINVCI